MEFKWVEIDKETGDRPSARFWHTVTVVKSNIYVIGGEPCTVFFHDMIIVVRFGIQVQHVGLA